MPSAPVTKAKQRAARLLQQQQHAYEQNVFNSYRRNFGSVAGVSSSISGGGNASTTNAGFGNVSGGGGGGKAPQTTHFPPTVRKSPVANISVDIERNVECVLSRKRAEMIESSGMHEKQRRVLRVYLFNTHNNDQVNNTNEGEENSLQATGKTKKVLKFTFGKKKDDGVGVVPGGIAATTAAVAEKKSNEAPPPPPPPPRSFNCDGTEKKWTFHVQGRVVNERDAEVDAREVLSSGGGGGGGLKFSHFIERMKIDVYDEQQNGKLVKSVAWERKECGVPKDGFTITVPGAKDSMRVRCEIHLRNDPPKFQLSGMLADVVGKEEESAGRVVYALWSRCKALELVSEKDQSMVELDETFLELCEKNPLFKEKKVGDVVPFRSVCIACTSRTHMPKISEPLVFEYKVRPYGPSPAHCDCYDVNVETLPPAAVGQNSAVTKYSAATNEPEELEQRIFQDSNFIDFARKRRAYLLSFSQDPQAFIDNCLMEYSEMFQGVPRRREAWSKEWTSDAAMRVLEKQRSS